MNKDSNQPVPPKKKSKMSKLLREISDDESAPTPSAPSDPTRPWYKDFRRYLDTEDDLPEDMTIVQWWGVRFLFHFVFGHVLTTSPKINASRYPVWASLARDYLAIMASSVSSERAFSSAGITISKRHSHLKGDIVEALQCLKCSIRNDLLFRAPPSSTIELEDEDDPASSDTDPGVDTAPSSWDLLLEDGEDDEYIDVQ